MTDGIRPAAIVLAPPTESRMRGRPLCDALFEILTIVIRKILLPQGWGIFELVSCCSVSVVRTISHQYDPCEQGVLVMISLGRIPQGVVSWNFLIFDH